MGEEYFLEEYKNIGKAMVEIVLTYVNEVRALREDDKRRLAHMMVSIMPVEMDCFRRSAGVSRLELVSNEEIRRRMKATSVTIIHRTEVKGFGPLLRSPDSR